MYVNDFRWVLNNKVIQSYFNGIVKCGDLTIHMKLVVCFGQASRQWWEYNNASGQLYQEVLCAGERWPVGEPRRVVSSFRRYCVLEKCDHFVSYGVWSVIPVGLVSHRYRESLARPGRVWVSLRRSFTTPDRRVALSTTLGDQQRYTAAHTQ